MEEKKVEEKIDPEKEKEINKKSNKSLLLIVGSIILLFVIILGVARIIQPNDPLTIEDMIALTLEGKTNPETNYIYNGFVFVKSGALWYTKWQVENTIYNIPLHYGPLELEDVKAEGKLDERFNSNSYYLTFDPLGNDFAHVAVATSELGLNMVKGLGVEIIGACTQNDSSVCIEGPIITCDNTNESVIFIKEDEDPKIVMDGNCMTIQGKGTDLLKGVDRVLLKLYGIME